VVDLDADGVATFQTRCQGNECAELMELTARWSGVTTSRKRLPAAERWSDTVDGTVGGGDLAYTENLPPALPGCERGRACLIPPLPISKGEPPCLEASLGGTASLRLLLVGQASAAETLRVKVSNGAFTSCRVGVPGSGETTFFGLAPGTWDVTADGERIGGSVTAKVTPNSLSTDVRLFINRWR
jgi:hypothetical protein